MKGKKQWKAVSKWRILCRDDWTQEQWHVILHYPDHGDGEYAADPAYGKSMSYRLLIYVKGKVKFLLNITPRFRGRFIRVGFDT